MVESGRQIAAALRHLDSYGEDPEAPQLAEALARFLVERAEARHAGWRVVRQLVVESVEGVPWTKAARRSVQPTADELLRLSIEAGRTPLHRAQHVAARARVAELSTYVEPRPFLHAIGLESRPVDDEEWADALQHAATARSREGAKKRLAEALGVEPRSSEPEPAG